MPEDVPHRRARRFFELWNTGGVEPAAERYWDPEIVWEESPQFPDAGVHHGRAACVRRMRERFEFIGKVQIELVDAWGDEDRMLIEAIIHGRGSSSGASFATHEFFLMEIEDGLATTFREFIDRDAAFEALDR